MIAAWMLYCVGIALAFVVVGHALERGLHFAGRPTRWAWIIALTGSFLVPVAAWVQPDAFAALPIPASAPAADEPAALAAPVGGDAASTPIPERRQFSFGELDTALRWGWFLSSGALLLALVSAALRLGLLRRGWRAAMTDGRVVLVSRNVGPAVVGIWRPRVVVPEWTLALDAQQRGLMLAHEEEHIRVGDPWLLAIGIAALLLAPWNLALWWQLRRLRLAVEMDCDARVLARGGSAPTYGELLLQVGRRRTRLPLGAPAFGEPASSLERRIRRIVTALPRWRWAGAAAAVAIAVGAVVAACEAPRPVATATLQAQAPAEVLVHRKGVSSDDVRPLLTRFFGPDPARLADSSVLVWFVVDRRGAVASRGTLPRPADGVLSAQTTAPRIPGYDTLRVGSILLHAERNLPPTIIVRLGEPPVRLGSSPVRVVSDSYPGPSADSMRRLARTYHPEVFARPQPGAAVAVVVDAQGRVVGHAAGVRKTRDRSCEEVLRRLLPAFGTTRFSSGGCADFGSEASVVVYWGQLRKT